MNFPTVSFLIPQLGRPEGLERCLTSLRALEYPQDLVEILVDDRTEPTVPEKVDSLYRQSKGEWLAFAANDTEWAPGSLKKAVEHGLAAGKGFVALNSGRPDQTEHFIIRRDIVGKLEHGQIFSTDFHHAGCDNWLQAQCDKLGESTRCEDAIVTHHHFTRGAEFDWIYERGWKHVNEDRATLKNKLSSL